MMPRETSPMRIKQNDPKIAPPFGVPRKPEERIAPRNKMIPKAIEERESRIFVPILTMDKRGHESYFRPKPTLS